MRKLEIENPEVMSIAIRQEIERSDESRYDHRLHGVLLVANGQSCREVALLFGEDPRTRLSRNLRARLGEDADGWIWAGGSAIWSRLLVIYTDRIDR